MPRTTTPEALLAQLNRPEWLAAGSTSRRPDAAVRTSRTEGGAPVNLTVLDAIEQGHRRLQLAEQALAAGQNEKAERIRAEVAARAAILTGDTDAVRRARCPYCATLGLLWTGGPAGRAVCSNQHCTPVAGTPRRWTLQELHRAPQRPVRRVVTGPLAPAPGDLVDLTRAVAFLASTGHPIARTTLTNVLTRYRIRTWRIGAVRALHASLSDVLVAHALYLQDKNGACDARSTDDRPACLGLSGLYETASTPARTQARARAAARVCATCPLRDTCSDVVDH